MGANFDYASPAALRRLVAAGTQLHAFPSEELQVLWKASHDLYKEISVQKARFEKI